MLRDGARMELEAKDGLAAIYRLPMTMVALDEDVAAQCQSALAQRHGEMACTVMQVIDGRSMYRNTPLIHLNHEKAINFFLCRYNNSGIGLWNMFADEASNA